MMREGLDALLLALKSQEGATIQGMQAASRSWKRKGNRFSSGASRKEHSFADTLIFSP